MKFDPTTARLAEGEFNPETAVLEEEEAPKVKDRSTLTRIASEFGDAALGTVNRLVNGDPYTAPENHLPGSVMNGYTTPEAVSQAHVPISKGVGPMREAAYQKHYAGIANQPKAAQQAIADSDTALANVAKRVQQDDPLSGKLQTSTEALAADTQFKLTQDQPENRAVPESSLGDAYSDAFYQLNVGANNIIGSPFQ